MTRYDLSPLFRSTVGFDRLARMLDEIPDYKDNNLAYPPYNIESVGEDRYRITMAVAGFTQEMLDISFHENMLGVSGKIPQTKEERKFLHHGLSTQKFEQKFQLDDYVKVEDAFLKDGLLTIDLVREIPEEMKPRTIEITQEKPANLLGKAKKIIEGTKGKAA
ncbi:Hsp20 family protein [Kiloniella majae]|uniref:Hsp20 family protein n=1 Tax=Kiloniella majae TaxID=1938558 RepID=UPI000A27911F|nr:Hsp20 family protein [Kiloniella majae]